MPPHTLVSSYHVGISQSRENLNDRTLKRFNNFLVFNETQFSWPTSVIMLGFINTMVGLTTSEKIVWLATWNQCKPTFNFSGDTAIEKEFDVLFYLFMFCFCFFLLAMLLPVEHYNRRSVGGAERRLLISTRYETIEEFNADWKAERLLLYLQL